MAVSAPFALKGFAAILLFPASSFLLVFGKYIAGYATRTILSETIAIIFFFLINALFWFFVSQFFEKVRGARSKKEIRKRE